jgi:hypothetical protein
MIEEMNTNEELFMMMISIVTMVMKTVMLMMILI